MLVKLNTRARSTGNDRRELWQRGWFQALLLVTALLLTYAPALGGQFLWDDDSWTFNLRGLFRDESGLAVMWTRITALQQYFPVTGTSFWLDYQLWGFAPRPYHIENVLLHACAVLLFWRLLQRLQVPGAALGALIFAFHPVHVESVAWITERKNVLSLVLYLGAMLAYGRYARFWNLESQELGAPHYGAYILALVLFLAAYLAKATAFSLPPVLLLISWWKRRQIRWKADVLPTVPFFILALGLGLVTSWLERTHLGAQGADWALSFPERCLIAGRALWFYAGKLVWPANLCFIYPRWHVEVTSPAQWLYPLTAGGVLFGLWLVRNRIGRAPAVAAFFFAGTLFPLLGFINGFFMRYSFVSDHWVYLPSLGLIALAAAGVARLSQAWRAPQLSLGLAALGLPVLAFQSFRQSAMYTDSETLFRITIARNPAAAMAYDNLGLILFRRGEADEAIGLFRKAVELRPDSAHAHNNLANALHGTGQSREALAHYEKSLQLEPGNPATLVNLAWLLATCAEPSLRNGPRAVELAQRAEQSTQGRNPSVLGVLAAAYAEAGRFDEAVLTARCGLELLAGHPESLLAETLQKQLEMYQAGLPFHTPEVRPETNAPAENPSQSGR